VRDRDTTTPAPAGSGNRCQNVGIDRLDIPCRSINHRNAISRRSPGSRRAVHLLRVRCAGLISQRSPYPHQHHFAGGPLPICRPLHKRDRRHEQRCRSVRPPPTAYAARRGRGCEGAGERLHDAVDRSRTQRSGPASLMRSARTPCRQSWLRYRRVRAMEGRDGRLKKKKPHRQKRSGLSPSEVQQLWKVQNARVS
jgi:hypothetical protein